MVRIMLFKDSRNCTRHITVRVTRNTTRHITCIDVILREIFDNSILTSVNPIVFKFFSVHCDIKTSRKASK